MPPPSARWSRPAVKDDEEERVYYATSSGGVFYFRDLTEAQREDWDSLNRPHYALNEKETANELRHKGR